MEVLFGNIPDQLAAPKKDNKNPTYFINIEFMCHHQNSNCFFKNYVRFLSRIEKFIIRAFK